VGWELVGACSFLLIGFWYRRPEAAAAAMKAFLTTRVGDVGLLLGIAVLWAATGQSSYEGALGNLGVVPAGVATSAAIAIAVGAIGKSAQFPLHAWLPDAMEGPTPVSALIHAATMVAAGVYLVVRVWPLFEAAPVARLVLLAAGTVSALGAALIALVQRDIKRVLAYSTVSQLGFMFVALGAGAWLAAFFHLVAHAAFKALLFLTSGSVIHGSGTQDMHEMGGLRKSMPVTFAAWLIGVLSLAGIPPLAGFFSKDLLLESVWRFSAPIGLVLLGVSALTAFYSARATRLVFFGASARDSKAHESPAVMLVPLAVLGVLVLVVGWLGGGIARLLGTESEPLNVMLSLAAVGSALLGATGGWLTADGAKGDSRTAAALGRLQPALLGALYWNSAVDRIVVRPTVGLSRALWAVGDRLVADGIAEGSGRLARRLGRGFSRLQGGDAQSYATLVALGFVLMMLATVWLGR
jgi:NADH-quinone oxidoreductase subunit L